MTKPSASPTAHLRLSRFDKLFALHQQSGDAETDLPVPKRRKQGPVSTEFAKAFQHAAHLSFIARPREA